MTELLEEEGSFFGSSRYPSEVRIAYNGVSLPPIEPYDISMTFNDYNEHQWTILLVSLLTWSLQLVHSRCHGPGGCFSNCLNRFWLPTVKRELVEEIQVLHSLCHADCTFGWDQNLGRRSVVSLSSDSFSSEGSHSRCSRWSAVHVAH